MRCTVCQADTAPDARFCWACGRPLRPSATGPTTRLVPMPPDHYAEAGIARLGSFIMRYPGAKFLLTADHLQLTIPAQWPSLRTPLTCTLPRAVITDFLVGRNVSFALLHIRHQQPHTPPFLAFETHHLTIMTQWLDVLGYPAPETAAWWMWLG